MRNLSHGVTRTAHNLLNLPDSVSFENGNSLAMLYMADGRRVATTSKTKKTNLSLPLDLSFAIGDPVLSQTDYRDGDVTRGTLGFTRLELPGGYLTFGKEFYHIKQGQELVNLLEGEYSRSVSAHFYVTDYLGSVRAVCNAETGAVEQTLDYLPSGAVFAATNYGLQPQKFCGKELLTLHGWNMYDSNARYLYANSLPRFTSPDPLAQLDYATSPYAYCQDDFVNLVDPWGLFADEPWWGWGTYELGTATVIYYRNGHNTKSPIEPITYVDDKVPVNTYIDHFEQKSDDGSPGNGGGSTSIWHTLGNVALAASAALIIDDASVVGVADDIAVPVLLVGSVICLSIDNLLGINSKFQSATHTKGARNSTSDKHTKRRPGVKYGESQEAKMGDKNKKNHNPPNPNKKH